MVTQFRLEHSRDGERFVPLADLSRERRSRANAYVELPAAVTTRYIRYVHGKIGAKNLAISDLRVWSLNRNFSLGAQRYAYGIWSGDIRPGFASMAGQRQRMGTIVTG